LRSDPPNKFGGVGSQHLQSVATLCGSKPKNIFYSRMVWCCGTVANVESPSPPSGKIEVNVPVASKPITLMSRAPSVDQHMVVVPVKKEEVVVEDLALTKEKERIQDQASRSYLFTGVAVAAAAATVVYYASNPVEFVKVMTPIQGMYTDSL